MQHDEVIWQVINQGFCSYKVKTPTANFCKNKYNVTGLCNRSACPLANSRYATVLEENGVCYLYIKTIERAHLPAKMWEKTRLHSNYATALQQINDALQYWPNFNVHKCKQRLTKIHQYLIRMRRLKLKVRTKLVGAPKKIERREATREKKAEKAARLDDAIVKELVARLHAGTYSGAGLYLPEKAYSKVLDLVGETEEVEGELGEDEEEEDEEENELEREFEGEDGDLEDEEFVADFGEDDEDEDDDEGDDLEDIAEAYRGVPFEEGGDDGEDGAAAAAAAPGRGRKRAGAASADDEDDAAAAPAAPSGSGRPSKKSRTQPAKAAAAKGGRRTGRVNVEYEQEHEQERETDR